MTDTQEQTTNYLSDFERLERTPASPTLQRLRKTAIARFAELGFPGPRDEEWKFTPLASLVQTPFRLEAAEAPFVISLEKGLPKGVIVLGLTKALQEYPELVEPHLARYADIKRNTFAALNTAFLRDGAGMFVYVPPDCVVDDPINLAPTLAVINLGPNIPTQKSDAPPVSHRRVLVVIGRNARATVVEHYAGPLTTYFTNAVTEIVVGDNADLDYYKVQEEGPEAYHMALTQVQLGRAARFSCHAFSLGSAWMRNEINAVFTGEGGECTLNGLYRGSGRQFLENRTFIDHAVPRCASHEVYKGILDGKARGVFNGKILVREDAQKTDAKQTNKTLLLSEEATINTKPQLEIYADDVKCTHGATVGQLDAESVFYLRSRGIGLREARELLTYAFANDVVSRVQVDSVRERLEQVLLTNRPKAEASEEQ